MWEPKQNRNITEDDNKFRADPTSSEKDEEYQSQCQDSGFLSGPQNLSEQLSDIHLDDDQPKSSSNQQQLSSPPQPQKLPNVLDSGLIEDIDTQSSLQQDSGIIDGDNKLRVEEENMILDSGVVADMSDRLGSLSLKASGSSSSMNNLGAVSKNTYRKQLSQSSSSHSSNIVEQHPSSPVATTFKFNQQTAQIRQNWELYYKQDDEGDTQLHLAIIHGLVDVVFALIRIAPHPCLLDIQNDLLQAPLHLAVITSQPTIVRRLLFSGAETTIRDRYGNSPLHLACISGDLACVKALTDPLTPEEINEKSRIKSLTGNGCFCLPDLEQRNYDGELCVHLATIGCHIDVLRQLIYCGADINAREGKAGRTPLHVAIEERKDVVVNFLLDECAEKLRLETVTYAGLTAYQLAAINENNEFLNGLSKKGAEPLSPPESDDDSDFEENMMDRYVTQQNLYRPFNGASAINVS